MERKTAAEIAQQVIREQSRAGAAGQIERNQGPLFLALQDLPEPTHWTAAATTTQGWIWLLPEAAQLVEFTAELPDDPRVDSPQDPAIKLRTFALDAVGATVSLDFGERRQVEDGAGYERTWRFRFPEPAQDAVEIRGLIKVEPDAWADQSEDFARELAGRPGLVLTRLPARS